MTTETLKTLRIAIAGSTDDGKSTLLGRLLIDSDNVPQDQLRAISDESHRLGRPTPEIAWLTDGLSTEQAKLITIDVAYRTIRWKGCRMQLIDTPGHLEYIQNTASGLSQADVLVLMLDISRDFTPQTLRHLQLAHMFAISHVVIMVNKMDTVDYRENTFTSFVQRFKSFCTPYIPVNTVFIPASALYGHNIVNNLNHTSWYSGPTLMDFLVDVDIPLQVHSQKKDTPTLAFTYWIAPNQPLAGIKVLSGTIQASQMFYLPDAQNHPILIENIYKDKEPVRLLPEGHSAMIAFKSPTSLIPGIILSSSPLQPLKIALKASSLLMQRLRVSDAYRWITPLGSIIPDSIEATCSTHLTMPEADFPIFTDLVITLNHFNPYLLPFLQRGLLTDAEGHLISITGKASHIQSAGCADTNDVKW